MATNDLKRLLRYKNPEVVARFSRDLQVPKKTAQTVFEDMLRFLWLTKRADRLRNSRKKKSTPQVAILEAMLIIDEMWHTFVLYTPDYTEFSMKYFGHFVHHVPTPILKSPKQSKEERSSQLRAYEQEVEDLIEFVWDELGEDVAKRWFKTFPEKFSKKEIRKRQFKAVA